MLLPLHYIQMNLLQLLYILPRCFYYRRTMSD
nr:MAG TPA: hypothetical protein [Caudoviricetes sp.]